MLAIPNKISYKKSLCCLTTAIKLNKRQTYNVCVRLYIVDMFFALHFRLTHAYFSNFCFSIFSSIFHFLYLLTILLTRWKHTSTHPHPNITKHFSLSLSSMECFLPQSMWYCQKKRTLPIFLWKQTLMMAHTKVLFEVKHNRTGIENISSIIPTTIMITYNRKITF